jgi:hypothetical protein
VSGLLPLIGELCRTEKEEIRFLLLNKAQFTGFTFNPWELDRAGLTYVNPDSAVAHIHCPGMVNKVLTARQLPNGT